MEHHDDFNRSTKKGSPRPGPLPVTSLYVDDPSEEKIEGTQLNCPDKIIKRSIFKPAVGSAPSAHEIPAGILRLAWDNPVGQELIKQLILGSIVLGQSSLQAHHALISNITWHHPSRRHLLSIYISTISR
jgi:hypothetical protein